MTRFMIAFFKAGGFGPIDAICGIHGKTDSLLGGSRQFTDLRALDAALIEAGIQADSLAMTALRSGYPSFIEVSEAHARSLGVLEQGK